MTLCFGSSESIYAQPKRSTLRAAHLILQYIKGTLGKGVLFIRGKKLTLEAYTNANYIGSVDYKRSTLDYCTFLRSNLVTWKSKT